MSYSSLLLASRIGGTLAALLAVAFIAWAVASHPPAVPPVTEPPSSGYGLAAPTGSPASMPAFTGSLLPAITGAPAVTSSGSLAYADPRFGRWYLALPDPRGTRAVICGPADCVTRTSTDYGPDQREHPERIADLSAVDFERVCGVDAVQRVAIGRCPGTVTILERPHVSLPATDAGE